MPSIVSPLVVETDDDEEGESALAAGRHRLLVVHKTSSHTRRIDSIFVILWESMAGVFLCFVDIALVSSNHTSMDMLVMVGVV